MSGRVALDILAKAFVWAPIGRILGIAFPQHIRRAIGHDRVCYGDIVEVEGTVEHQLLGQECGGDPFCGDGIVNLFDILEAVDIILGLTEYTDCQFERGNVPNGLPPYCGNPAGTPNCESDDEIDILDVLVIIDRALRRANCCDYCYFGEIF